MVKPLFAASILPLLLLLCLAAPATDVPGSKNEASLALLEDTQAWIERANFWQLVARGETLSERVTVELVKSNQVEAWICGTEKICVSARLLHELSPEEQHAALAHEIGHLIIPRNYDAH